MTEKKIATKVTSLHHKSTNRLQPNVKHAKEPDAQPAIVPHSIAATVRLRTLCTQTQALRFCNFRNLVRRNPWEGSAFTEEEPARL